MTPCSYVILAWGIDWEGYFHDLSKFDTVKLAKYEKKVRKYEKYETKYENNLHLKSCMGTPSSCSTSRSNTNLTKDSFLLTNN